MERQHAWEDVIDDEIRQLAGNYAARQGLGRRPAVLCIDTVVLWGNSTSGGVRATCVDAKMLRYKVAVVRVLPPLAPF